MAVECPSARCTVTTLLTAALTLADNGWGVLPLQGKAPLTRHGSHDASSSRHQIEKWWCRRPTANIGGAVPSSVLVLDLDPRNGGDRGWDELVQVRIVPVTLTTISGRGDGGRHMYFLRPAGQLSRHGLPPGIDLKTNGYCVLPPSLHPETGGSYEWAHGAIASLPIWLRDVLRPRAVGRPAQRVRPSSGSVQHLVDFVACQEPGNRNAALYWASRKALDLGVLGQAVESLVDAAVRAGETEHRGAGLHQRGVGRGEREGPLLTHGVLVPAGHRTAGVPPRPAGTPPRTAGPPPRTACYRNAGVRSAPVPIKGDPR